MRINGRYVDRELYNFGIVIGLTLLFYVNVLSTKYNKLGIVIGKVGILIVFLLLSINKITISYLFFLAFLTTTIEVQEFVYGYVLPDNLVVRNFLILPGFHLWPVYIYNIVVFAYLFLQLRISIWRKILRFKGVKCLYFFSLLTLFAGLTMTIITYLMNDNGITDMYWLLDKFQAEFYRISMVFFTIQINIMLLIRYPEYKGQLVSFSKAIFLSIVLAGYISVFSGYHGYYGDRSDIMLLPLFSFFFTIDIYCLSEKKKTSTIMGY